MVTRRETYNDWDDVFKDTKGSPEIHLWNAVIFKAVKDSKEFQEQLGLLRSIKNNGGDPYLILGSHTNSDRRRKRSAAYCKSELSALYDWAYEEEAIPYNLSWIVTEVMDNNLYVRDKIRQILFSLTPFPLPLPDSHRVESQPKTSPRRIKATRFVFR